MTRAVTLWGFSLIAAAMVAYQALGLLRGRTATLGQAVTILTSPRAVRLLVLAAWLFLGWHLFVRATWR